ncbi:MAG: hypothetical protein EPN36_12830 [Rhodanobacteraceae bacterium]|nr:MAG: hypothetical protein EPN36_12830 [Rhodanobacteraceae bacterium]
MRKSTLLLASASLLALSFGAMAAEQCRYSAPRNAEIDAAGLKQLAVQIGPDDLNIHGDPGVTTIVVHGTACASNQKWLPDIKLEAARHGDSASVVAHDGDHIDLFSLFGSNYAYLKLDVSVPQTLAVKLMEGSGDAQARSLAALDASLGSGDLKVNGVSGAFGLSVGSGDAVAGDVGSLDLSSLGSGDVTVDGVHANAHVGSVGSGDLHLANVKGDVAIGSIGSGDAKVATVGGSLKADSVGSGSLVVRDVTRNVAVGSISSGEVGITHAGGSVHADSLGSGDFGADGVGGDFSVGAVGSGDVHHHGVKGKVSVPKSDD